MPVVSVVLPVHNGADFIADAINSVLSQSFENFEFIIRDDRSTDQTRGIVTNFTDKRIFIENDMKLGQFGNFNACFDVSSGEFIHLFSYDDIMHPNCLESQLGLLRKYDNAGMVFCGIRNIDASGLVLNDSSENGTPEFISRDLYLSLSAHYGSLPASISTVMIRREVLEAVGTFDPRMKVAGDTELWNRIADKYPIVYNRKIVADIRSHMNQVTNIGMTGLWYIKEKIGMTDWYRKRLSKEDWTSIEFFRARTCAEFEIKQCLRDF
jgi:glycosyltransferase involved in cell wall biosynthesis